jgi:hypothetical protein
MGVFVGVCFRAWTLVYREASFREIGVMDGIAQHQGRMIDFRTTPNRI